MRFSVVLLAFCAFLFASEPVIVESVEVKGSDVHVNLETQVGRPYDEAAVQRDVKYLWGLGKFDDVRAEANGGEVKFIVRTKPHYTVREIRFSPHSYGLHPVFTPGTVLEDVQAQRIAADTENQLRLQGYRNAVVTYEFVPLSKREVSLHLNVTAGESVRVKDVVFDGTLGLKPNEVRNALVALKPRKMIPGIWRMLPDYSPEAVDGDVNRLRSLYLARGFFDARVSADDPSFNGSHATVRIHIDSGPRFEVHGMDLKDLCPCMLAQRREAERKGILDFTPTLLVRREGDGVATISTKVDLGAPYFVRRIEFYGLHRYNDATARRNMLLDEGDLLDQYQLRKSISRLMQSQLFADPQQKDVVIARDEAHHVADIRIRLTERKIGSWKLSGPVGPASIAGPLQASITSRLPKWATYSISLGMVAWAQPILPILGVKKFIPILSLTRGFLPGDSWKSGFAIIPQIGWQGSLIASGAAQLTGRLLPALTPDKGLNPELLVAVDGDVSGTILCDAPKPKLRVLRGAASIAVRMPGALAGF